MKYDVLLPTTLNGVEYAPGDVVDVHDPVDFLVMKGYIAKHTGKTPQVENEPGVQLEDRAVKNTAKRKKKAD